MLAESAELGGIAEPPALVPFGRRRGIGYAFVLNAGKSHFGEKLCPFGGRKQMRRDTQNFAPLMSMHVFAVVVDEHPGRAAFAQNAVNFAQSGARIGPVVCSLDGNRVREEVGVPGNFSRLPDDKHGVLEIEVIAAGAANHLVGNIDSDDSPLGHLLGNETSQPTRAAANVEDVIFGAEAHAVEHRKDDGQVILLHALAAAGFRPAVEFLTQRLGMISGIRGLLHLTDEVGDCRDRLTSRYMPASSAEGP